MEQIKLDFSGVSEFVSKEEIQEFAAKTKQTNQALHDKTGLGNDFLGWVNLPDRINNLAEIKETAKSIRKIADFVVVIGIGGSRF
jgi:glucose-6-phosphate isomerase